MKIVKTLSLYLIICISFIFQGLSHGEVILAGAEIMPLTYGDITVNVRLDSKKTAFFLNTKPINCYQFSTANPVKDYPGNLKKKDFNAADITEALKEEGAIQILFDKGASYLEEGAQVDHEKNYYIIGVMWYPGEYHFVRLFMNGWFSKPSKVGSGGFVTDKIRLPSEALGYLLSKPKYKFLGFFLHPNRDEYINQLLNNH